jgi:PTH1 family peptidyl-tRNA hydrolase
MKWLWSWRSARSVADETYVVVGLGNPGEHYAGTRHNLGASAVRFYASQCRWPWKRERKLLVHEACGERHGKQLRLVVPMTYMNESGRAVARYLKERKVPLDHVLVLVDDVALPLGGMRLRAQGSSGGHNGLKSLGACLGTDEYARLRLGIGAAGHQDLADYVLEPFAHEEKGHVSEMERRAAELIDVWMTEGLERAMEETKRQ